MVKVYSMENVEDISGYDQYIKDFEEQAAEYCKTSGKSLLQSIFAQFTTECGQGVYLSAEETKKGIPIRFEFRVYILEETGEPVVSYGGYV